jgi:hypothetical protein
MREENEIKHIELYTKFIERYRNDIQKKENRTEIERLMKF